LKQRPPASAPAALKREWYAKLRASGFQDIETGDEHDGLLKTDKRFQDGHESADAAQAEYYRLASSFLYEHRFKTPRDRRIWEAHAEGVPMREIAKRCRTYVRLVHATVNTLRALMLAEPTSRMGRPRVPGGRSSATAWKLQVRLTDHETEALHWLARELGIPAREAARHAIRLLVSQKSGNGRAAA